MQPTRQMMFKPFRLDPNNACLWRGTQRVALTPKAFMVLQHLVTRQGQLVTKDALLEAIWPDTVVGDAVLKVCIREIRRTLGDTAKTPRFIATVYRQGYRFVKRVDTVDYPSIPPQMTSTRRQQSANDLSTSSPLISADSNDEPFAVHSTSRQWHAEAYGHACHPQVSLSSPPQLVGRGSAVGHLHRRLERACQGKRQVVFVTGEAGIGKTALVEAFAAQVTTARVQLVS